jgi:hypothetical protein
VDEGKATSSADARTMPGWLPATFVASLLVPVALFSWALERTLWTLAPMALLALFWLYVIRRYLRVRR